MDKSAEHIEGLNFEAQHFLVAFKRFRSVTKTIDTTLCASLLRIVKEIEEFLNTSPKHVSLRHLRQLTPNDLNNIGIQRGFFCHRCKSLIGNSIDAVRIHIKQLCKAEGKNSLVIKAPPTKATKDPILPNKLRNLVTSELPSFFSQSSAVASKLINLFEYEIVDRDLVALVQPAFLEKTVRVYPFGSRVSGTASPHSDLDIFLDIGSTFNHFENTSSNETKSKLKIVKGLLQSSPEWENLVAVESARVPIIKATHKPSRLNCDIGFANSLGYCNSMLLQYLLNMQPIARILCLLMKRFVERLKLTENVVSYGICLLVIYYFQNKHLLPSIKDLQEGLEDANYVGPWMGSFCHKTAAELNISVQPYEFDTFKTHLIQFLKFYGKFRFEQFVICPYLGECVEIKSVDTNPKLSRYVDYITKEDTSNAAKFKKNIINVQDPFQLNHNVMKNVPPRVVTYLKASFTSARQLIASTEAGNTRKVAQK